MNRYFASAAVVGVVAGLGLGADLKSGPQPGQSVPVFNPLNVTGPDAGEKRCPVWANGNNPVALVFAREATPGLTSLVRKLEAATAAHADAKLRAVVVVLSDDDKTEDRLKELAEKEKLKKVVLAVDNPQGPAGYKLAKDAEVTVVLYERKKVKKNLAYEKGKLTEAEADAVAAQVKDILPAKGGSE